MKLGLTRVRNEEVIIKSTLDLLSHHLDGVIALDDCSTDNTRDILYSHPLVLQVIENDQWRRQRDTALPGPKKIEFGVGQNVSGFDDFIVAARAMLFGKDTEAGISSFNIFILFCKTIQ